MENTYKYSMGKINSVLNYSDFITVPLALVFIFTNVKTNTIGIFGGIILWTLIEYWTHRLLHSRHFPRLRRFHMHHHQHPTHATGGTLYSTLLIVLLSGGATMVASLGSIILGLLFGYFIFITVHQLMHIEFKSWFFIQPLADAHEAHHHKAKDRKYGVITTFWDHIFQTN